MNVTVRPLDTSSDVDIAGFSRLDEECDAAVFGGIERYSTEQTRARLAPNQHWDLGHYVAVDGRGAIVGSAGTSIPLSENLEAIHVDLMVHPDHRGHGVGTALMNEALIPAIRASGRSLVTGYGTVPSEGDPDDPELPVNKLATHLGVSRKNVAVCRILDLPQPVGLLEELDAQAAEKLGDYEVVTFTDTVPEEHLAGYGTLLRQLELDEPDEDVEHEAPEYTPERIRLAEQRRRDTGKRSIIAVAVAPDGTFAGNSAVEFQEDPASTLGWQENTLVMPDHRGHRLGLALKVATHSRLATEAPGLRSLVTWNSHVNPWMIAINEQLGYRISHREVAYQGRPAL